MTGASPTPDIDVGLVGRTTTAVAASSDVVLRTLAATLVASTAVPSLVSGALSDDADLLPFYVDLADEGDAASTFAAPTGLPDVTARRQRPWSSGRLRGRVDLLSWPSRFEPRNPAMAGRYPSSGPNATCWAQHWKHADGPRPTLLVCHGFTASPYLVNSAFFSLPWLYSHGYDVVLLTLPFHGKRRSWNEPYSGAGLFRSGLSHLNEAMFQAVHDIRSLIDHLERIGVPDVGMTGISLGGYTTAMLAATEPRLAFAIPNCAVTDLTGVLDTWFPMSTLFRTGLQAQGIDESLYRRALQVSSPLNYPAQIAHDRRFIIHGLGDRLAPPVHGMDLWEHWGQPRVHWFPGNHTLHVNRAAYLRRMGRFLNEIDFAGRDTRHLRAV